MKLLAEQLKYLTILKIYLINNQLYSDEIQQIVEFPEGLSKP